MMKRFSLLATALCLVLQGAGCAVPEVELAGEKVANLPVVLTIDGPSSSEKASPNPFLDYRFAVRFSNTETGDSYLVPGFYAADGKASETGSNAGNKWRAYFTPPEKGRWVYEISFRSGPEVALSNDLRAGHRVSGDGSTGSFDVEAASEGKHQDDMRMRGRLRYVGQRYLRFSESGDYFLKSGADSPENFLAYAEFDGEGVEQVRTAERREGEAAPATPHQYQEHVQDWVTGDPTWGDGKGKGIIGALNYLASKGVNSVYFLTMNLQGDGDDVWPYTSREERFRFDCSKLDQWNIVFDQMDRRGIMLHVVLTETENESIFEVEEGGDFARRRKLYYRELVARFGHHSAITWNIGEENGWAESEGLYGRANTDEQRQAFADYIRSLDPYNSPIVVHTWKNFEEVYVPLLGASSFEGPSLQIADVRDVHQETVKWVERSRQAGKDWFVCLDEIGPASAGVKPDSVDPDHYEVRHYGLWGNLMGGGAGCEWYFGYEFPHNDLNLEDFRSREKMWDLTRLAVEFFHSHLPFPEMYPRDDLLTNSEGYCLAKEGHVYAVYLGPSQTTEIWLPEATYQVRWYNPRSGGDLQIGSEDELRGEGFCRIGTPPNEKERDWVALIKLQGEPPPVLSAPPA